MSYTPPAGDCANLKFSQGYSAPAGDAAILSFAQNAAAGYSAALATVNGVGFASGIRAANGSSAAVAEPFAAGAAIKPSIASSGAYGVAAGYLHRIWNIAGNSAGVAVTNGISPTYATGNSQASSTSNAQGSYSGIAPVLASSSGGSAGNGVAAPRSSGVAEARGQATSNFTLGVGVDALGSAAVSTIANGQGLLVATAYGWTSTFSRSLAIGRAGLVTGAVGWSPGTTNLIGRGGCRADCSGISTGQAGGVFGGDYALCVSARAESNCNAVAALGVAAWTASVNAATTCQSTAQARAGILSAVIAEAVANTLSIAKGGRLIPARGRSSAMADACARRISNDATAEDFIYILNRQKEVVCLTQ